MPSKALLERLERLENRASNVYKPPPRPGLALYIIGFFSTTFSPSTHADAEARNFIIENNPLGFILRERESGNGACS
jgi:hypothetical protein